MKKCLFSLLLALISIPAFSSNIQFIVRKEIKLSLDNPSKKITSFLSPYSCQLKRLGTEEVIIESGDVLNVSAKVRDITFYGEKTVTAPVEFDIDHYYIEKKPAQMAYVFTLTLDLNSNKKVQLSCVGNKTDVTYKRIGVSSADMGPRGSMFEMVNSPKDQSIEDFQLALEKYFEVQAE